MLTGDGAVGSEAFDQGADEILSSPVFGAGLPAEAERHLREAALILSPRAMSPSSICSRRGASRRRMSRC